MRSPSIAFVADDSPIREDVAGWGLSRVNARLVAALETHVRAVACGSNGLYARRDLPGPIRSISSVWGEQTRWQRFRRRRLGAQFDADAAFSAGLPRIAADIAKANVDVLFSPCGVDPSSLGRAVAIKRETGKPLAAYFVDDFLEGALLADNARDRRIASDSVPDWMREVDRAFVISDGLKRRFATLYGIDATVLHLPYRATEAPVTPSLAKDQIIFVGNLSHFYLPGLRDLVEALASMRRRGRDITLRFTLPDEATVRRHLGTTSGIECRACETAEELQREVGASLAAFAPYSFDAEHAVMVETSFPSKMLDYLSAARQVVTYGPAYSTAARYFAANGLETAVTTRGVEALLSTLEAADAKPDSRSATYRRALAANHAPATVGRQLLAGLA